MFFICVNLVLKFPVQTVMWNVQSKTTTHCYVKHTKQNNNNKTPHVFDHNSVESQCLLMKYLPFLFAISLFGYKAPCKQLTVAALSITTLCLREASTNTLPAIKSENTVIDHQVSPLAFQWLCRYINDTFFLSTWVTYGCMWLVMFIHLAIQPAVVHPCIHPAWLKLFVGLFGKLSASSIIPAMLKRHQFSCTFYTGFNHHDCGWRS